MRGLCPSLLRTKRSPDDDNGDNDPAGAQCPGTANLLGKENLPASGYPKSPLLLKLEYPSYQIFVLLICFLANASFSKGRCGIGALSQVLFVTCLSLARRPGAQPACEGGDDLAAMLGWKFTHVAVPGGTGSGGGLGRQG